MTRLWSQGKPIEVVMGNDGIPQSFHCFHRWWRVAEICNRWRVQQGWWTEEDVCCREYYKVLSSQGLLCLLFHNFREDDWFLERVYD